MKIVVHCYIAIKKSHTFLYLSGGLMRISWSACLAQRWENPATRKKSVYFRIDPA